jgi:GalNAc-alpha-(1->4)-GalNAc-alpha-(1->3)-diNAcBac-PP-undecaprenol alpha-1,4-N-acetyl-D-galactosaminyltransferase
MTAAHQLESRRPEAAKVVGPTTPVEAVSRSGEDMRLTLVIASLDVGGAERVLSTMASYWAAKGHEVTLLTLADVGSDFFKLHPRVHRLGLGLVADAPNAVRALWNNIVRLSRLRRAILATRPNVVISFITQVNVLTLLSLAGTRVPVVVSERTEPAADPVGGVWRGLRRLVYRWARAVVVQSEEVRANAKAWAPGAVVRVVPNPVARPSGVSARAEQASPVVISAGRLVLYKGFDVLVRAFARCAPHHSEWRLCIVGDGPEHQSLAQLAQQLGIAERCEFPGRASDLAPVFARAALFVLPSRYEGFPNVLLEAMAHQLPAVSTDCPSGPRHIIEEGVDGLLVPVDDVDALATAMDRLMGDPVERRRLGERAGGVTERFGVDRVMAMWDGLVRAAYHSQTAS